MNYKQIPAILIVASLIFQTIVAAQTKKADQRFVSMTPELKKNALKLLSSSAAESGQLSATENRVRARMMVADLLWEEDERAARAAFQGALGDLQNLLAAVNPPEGTEMNRSERAAFFQRRGNLADLRHDFVLALAARDPQAALSALGTLQTRLFDEYDPLAPSGLILKTSAVIARQDPEKSYAVAKQQLEAEGLTYEFVLLLKSLHGQDSRLAANLGKDVLAKLKTLKIRIPSEIQPASATPPDPRKEIDAYRVTYLINTITELNRTASRDKEKKMSPLLTPAEMKELVEITANAFLGTIKPNSSSISSAMPEITQFAPALAQKIRVKIGAEAARQMDKNNEYQIYFIEREEKSAAQLAKAAETAAPDVRDQRLSDAAFKALQMENDALAAQAIAARIKNRKNFEYLFDEINEALPLAKARRGDLAEVRKIVAALKTDKEKINVASETAIALAAHGERETAKKLLDETLALLPSDLKNYADIESAVKFAAAYAVVEPERAFTILENAAAQSDEYINAGVKMGEFYTVRSTEGGELLFSAINEQFLTHVPNATRLIRDLSRADFDRTVALADKFQRSEIRQFVRLQILQALLDEKASDKEKQARERIAADQEG